MPAGATTLDPGAAGSSCPKAVSIYAMQKTGSTFLARLSTDISLHSGMCRTYQNTKEFLCQTTIYVDCPRNERHRKSVSLKNTFTNQRPMGERGPKCTGLLRRKMFLEANNWLRSTNVSVRYRYNRSMAWLLSPSGFLRGPVRQLYTEYADNAVPSFPGYDNVLVVHTRHPVEMMVSAFHCITDPKVCHVRSKFMGGHVPKNDTVRSVDDFVLSGVRRPGSTPHSILQRSIAITSFMQAFGRSAVRSTGRRRACAQPRLLQSKYELMVTNFTTWAGQVLEEMVADRATRWALHAKLAGRYKNDFVPDGKHKHALHPGANIAQLKPETIRRLAQDARLSSLLADLGYDWFGLDGPRGA